MNIRLLLALAAAFLAFEVQSTKAADSGQIYELRIYTTKSAEQQKQINDYWQNAGVPAYNRLGVQSVGVFTELQDSDTNKIYVLLPFDSINAFAGAAASLAADDAHQKAGETFLMAGRTNAPFVRYESSLLQAMEGQKKIALPTSTAEKKPWIFEMRTYFSPSDGKGKNKVDMFNAGEIQIMQEIGLSPVFFARTIVGPQLPSLVYMVSGENQEAYKKIWSGFGPHPVWKKLNADPQYKDNMAGSKSVFLKRTSASQI